MSKYDELKWSIMGSKISYTKERCPVCENPEIREVVSWEQTAKTSQTRYLFKVNEAICQKCGLMQQSPSPSDAFLDTYYSEKENHSNTVLDYDLNKRLSYFTKNFKKNVKVLEIGSNEGSFINALSDIGYETVAYDPCNENNVLPSKKVDVVVMNHTLEHIKNPVSFLTDLKKYLSEEMGSLIIEVPNLYFYQKDHTPIFHEHLFHFTPESLELVLTKAGYLVEDIEFEEVSRPVGFKVKAKPSPPEELPDLRDLIQRNSRLYPSSLKVFKAAFQRIEDRKTRYLELIESLNDSFSNEKVILWGANNICLDLVKIAPESFTKRLVIVDGSPSKQNTLLEKNFIINSPQVLNNISNESKSAIICAVSWAEEIKKDLLKFDFPEENIFIAPY